MKFYALLLFGWFFTVMWSPSFATGCVASSNIGSACSVSCPLNQGSQCSASQTGNPNCVCSEPTHSAATLADNSFAASQNANPNNIVEQDVRVLINQRLAGLSDYALSQSCSRQTIGERCDPDLTPCVTSVDPKVGVVDIQMSCHPRNVCTPEYGNVCSNVMGKLQLGDSIQFEKGPVATVSEPNWNAVPSEFIGFKETYSNCSPVDQTFTYQHAAKTTSGSRVTKSKTVVTGRETTVSLNADYKVLSGFGGGASASVKFNNTVSISDSAEQDFQKEEDLTFTLPVSVPKMQEMVVVHYWIRRVVPIPYSGTVQVNGPVAQNIAGVNTVSQVLQNTADRTFEFAGVISDALLEEGNTSTTSRPIDTSCNAGTVTVTDEYLTK